MTLQFIDKRLIGGFIIDAWQNQLNTEMDPADGRWFTNGPNNNGGLYGKLTDTLATELIFDASKSVFTPHQILADTRLIDNRNGLTPSATVTLTYSYQDSSTSTHSTTNAVKASIGIDIKDGNTVAGVGVDVTTKLSFEYSYSWTDTDTTATSETLTFTNTFTVQVPNGKAYQAVLLCNKDTLVAPYRANIYLSGQSVANFASPVNGQQVWSIDAGSLCAWINQYGSAGDASSLYGRDPKNPSQGAISLYGNITANRTTNFTIRTVDITNTWNGDQPPNALVSNVPVVSEKAFKA